MRWSYVCFLFVLSLDSYYVKISFMQNVISYFKASVSSFPDKIAVSDGDVSYTYARLDELSNTLAAFIHKKQEDHIDSSRSMILDGPEPIGIIVHRDCDTLLAFLAVIKSGNFYVPIDPKLPPGKMEKILEETHMPVILGDDRDADIVPAKYRDCLYSIEEATRETTALDEDAASFIEKIVEGRDDRYGAYTHLYMVFTSGSTGTPKGVLKSHKAVIDFIEAYTGEFDFSSNEIIGNQTPFFFDASAKDIYLAWKLGATLEIIPDGMFTLPPALIRYLNEKKVSFISWVPSALSIVTQLNTFEEVMPETIRKIFFVGESFPIKQFKKWHEALPDIEYVNLYGASELAGICCFYRVPDDIDSMDRLPIGKPLSNCEVILVDGDEVVTEPGKTGEILLKSAALFNGYYQDIEKTDSCYKEIDGKMFFKTGDLAWYDENGDLNFAARNDSQIKHMGQRIELGDIEATCSALPEIEKACCLYNTDKKRIYLFCELSEGNEEDQKSLLIKLKDHLVSYMMPQRVVIKEKLPLNANGKIDRQLLAGEMK